MGVYSPKFKKWFAGLMLGWFGVLAGAGLFLMQAEPTAAQEPTSGGEAAEATAEGAGVQPPEAEPGEAAETVNRMVGKRIVTGLLVSGLEVLEFAGERLAHMAANAILRAGKGQGGLLYEQTGDEAWVTYGKEVAGEAIGSLSQNIGKDAFGLDFNLCQPTAPSVQMSWSLSLLDTYEPEPPSCEWQNVYDNWDGLVSTAVNDFENPGPYLMQKLGRSFSPSQNELSASISFQAQVLGESTERQNVNLLEQLTSGGYKNLVDDVTNGIKTPSSTLKETFEERITQAEQGKIDLAKEGLFEGAKLGEAGVGITVKIISAFVKTLAGGWIQKALQDGLNNPSPPSNPLDPNLASLSGNDDLDASESRLVTRNPLSLTDYNALGAFITCPTGPNIANRKSNNCVMDQSFFSAVAEGGSESPLTIQEAIDQGLLKGNWPLIPPEDEVRNQDPLCYTYAYCHSNLVKLRKARVIPVGWEIAAQNAVSGDGSFNDLPTLQEVANNFDNCGEQGSDTDGSKWCGLIDPNWILKYPETQCRAETFGEVLATTLGSSRAEQCVDTPSCIDHDKNGNCIGGYGYCTRERNTWEFRGDACPSQYASCLSFENTRTGDGQDYLLNTVDFSICGEDNVGCRWYRTNKYLDNAGTPNDGTDDTYQWLPEESDDANATSYDLAIWDEAVRFDGPDPQSSSTSADTMNRYAYEDRIYFNANAEQCDASAAGCTEMYAATDGLDLNLVANPSFENDENNDGAPDRWLGTAGQNYSTDGSEASFGSASVSGSGGVFSGQSWRQESIRLAPNSFYTLSYYAKGSGDGNIGIRFTDLEGQWSQSQATALSNTTTVNCQSYSGVLPSGTPTPVGWDTVAPSGELSADEFTRFACTFTTISEPMLATVGVKGGSDVHYDGVQLQLGEFATSYTEGYDANQPESAYLRMPPAYLGCNGEPDDPPACDNYAQVCTQQDVGCNMYTPEDGDPSVPAVISDVDTCPAECVGYTAYKQEPTKYESANIPFPQHFIADTATACSQENVGCDGFTNLEAVDAGGEGVEHYTDLRTCQDPEDTQNEATYFTWQGSEQAGYQLQTWNLLASNSNDGPCVNAGMGNNRTTMNCSDPAYSDETIGDPNDMCNSAQDVVVNPDCREFIDENGNSYFRELSKTVLVSDQCTLYRKNDSDQQNCDASGGYWDAATSECFYLGLPEQSDACPATAASCRAYTGSAGRNASTILNETFEGGTYEDFESYDNANVIISNESIATDGLSLRVANGGVETLHESISSECTQADGCEGDPNGCTIDEGETGCGTLNNSLVAGKTFTAQFWALGDGQVDLYLVEDGGNGAARSITQDTPVNLNENWRQYTVGPLDSSEFSGIDENAVLRIAPAGSDPSDLFYIDNLELTQSDQIVPLIKDSWVTPATCDQAPNGTEAPQYYLGCEAYTDQTGEDENLYQFSRLCSEEVVGCGAFYDTQNTESPYGQTYNARCATTDGTAVSSGTECIVNGESYCTIATGNSYCTFDFPGEIPAPLPSASDFRIELGPSAVTVSNDVPTYLVDDGTARCNAADAGCTAVGTPEYNLTRTEVQSFSEEYYINDPDTYGETLCKADALFCEEWSTTDDGNYYFKDPGKKTCEYQQGITLAGTSYSGWFRQGTNEPCYWTDTNDSGSFEVLEDDAYVIGGTQFGVWRNGDDLGDRDGDGTVEPHEGYSAWVASCPSSADQCTAFSDPTDTQDGEMPNGTVYTYINDEKMSEEDVPTGEKCNGSVSRKEGCVLFNNRNIPEVRYNAAASYIASKHADYLFNEERFSPQDPISCAISGIEVDGAGNVDTAATWPDGEIDPPGADGPLNLCAQRCTYQTSGETTLDIPNADVYENSNPVTGEVIDRKYATGSCVFDSDCSGYKGSDDGKMYAGDCQQPATQENLFTVTDDTNQVLKVNRDRECAEWLACKSAVPSYDKRTGEWVNKCDAIGLCTEYNRQGESARCASWTESENEILTRVKYANRDVSWTGLEYSGYSIPNQVPVDQLREVDLKEEDADQPDVRLANFVGVCDSETLSRGESCAIGYCQDTPSFGCSSDASCPGVDGDPGVCVKSVCKERTNEICNKNSDCDQANGYACNTGNGRCERVVTDAGGDAVVCSTGADCDTGAGEVCALSPRTKAGSCFNNKCVQNIAGKPINSGLGNVEDKACRGYPEGDSPYPATTETGIVESWRYVNEGSDNDTVEDDTWKNAYSIGEIDTPSAKPQSLIQRFQNVNTCGLDGNGDHSDCVCSYQKLEYGGSDFGGTMTKYYGLTFEEGAELENDAAICVGGEFAGRFCSNDDECGRNGECKTPERRDTVLGWEGFCLERDEGINLYNNTSKKPCLTWYPVDQLSGSTDLYAKYTQAGYEPQDTYYCAETELYFDIGASGNACTGSRADDDNQSECTDHAVCPPGFFTIYSDAGCGSDCQFRCVPKLARHTGSKTTEQNVSVNADLLGDLCLPPTLQSVEGRPTAESHTNKRFDRYENNSGSGVLRGFYLDMYEISNADWADVKEYYSDCMVRGLTRPQAREYIHETFNGPELSNTTVPLTSSFGGDCSGGNPGVNPAFCGRDIPVNHYLGCSKIAQTSTEQIQNGRYNLAWTNRVWGALDELYTIGTEPERFEFTQDNFEIPFGQATDVEEFVNQSEDDPFPQRVPFCVRSEGSGVDKVDYQRVKGLECPSGQGNGWQDAQAGETHATGYVDMGVASNQHLVKGGDELIYGANPSSRQSSGFTAGGQGIANTCEDIDPATGSGTCKYQARYSQLTNCQTDFECKDFLGAARTTEETMADAYQRLRQIFASGLKVYAWNWDQGQMYEQVAQTESFLPNTQELTQMWQSGGNEDSYTYTEIRYQSESDRYLTPYLIQSQYVGREEWRQTSVGDAEDDTEAVGVDPSPPQIWSVGACEGTECAERQEGAFSLDNLDQGNITGDEEKYVTLRFFTRANENQMPIRNIVADWGDGINGVRPDGLDAGQRASDVVGSITDDNFYRNHRGYVGDTSQCEADDTFAGAQRACDDSYIAMTNHYVCNVALLNTYPECEVDNGKLLNAPCKGGEVAGAGGSCVFQPRISVKDNWGWCTGTCPGGADGTDECYDAEVLEGIVDLGNNECEFKECPGPLCDATDADPWVYYNGYVIIEP